MTLLAADISSHNAVTNWGAFLGSIDALIPKITEGIGYAWAGAANALTQARNAGKCVGVYHFASAGDPVAEANYFLAHYAHQPGEVIVLDWEPTGFTGDADAWAYAWCQRVIAATGVVPLLYLNHFYATQQSQWPRTRSLGCGLWAAWYGANTGTPQPGMPSFAPWPSPAMWQYTSQGSRPGHSGALDLNQFFGTPDQWRAYGNGTQEADMTPAESQMLSDVLANVLAIRQQDFVVMSERTIPGLLDIAIPRAGTDQQGQPQQGETNLRQTVAWLDSNLENIRGLVKGGQDPQSLADAILSKLPAAQAEQVAELVLAGIASRMNQPPQPAPAPAPAPSPAPGA